MLTKITTAAVALLMVTECTAVTTERRYNYTSRARVNRQSRNYKEGDLIYGKCDMKKNMGLNEVKDKLPRWVWWSNIKATMMVESRYTNDITDYYENANILLKFENLDFKWDLEPGTTLVPQSHPQVSIVSHYDRDYDVSSCTKSDKWMGSVASSTNYVGYDPTLGLREQEEEEAWDTPTLVAIATHLSIPDTTVVADDASWDDLHYTFDHRQVVAEMLLTSWDISAANINYGADEVGEQFEQEESQQEQSGQDNTVNEGDSPLVVGCCRWGHMNQKSALRFYKRYFGPTTVAPPEGLKEIIPCEEQQESKWYGVVSFPKYEFIQSVKVLDIQQPSANCAQIS